jgi:outer membrane protein assembly factor BamE (lipoprotein component of BamABCDE complex)
MRISALLRIPVLALALLLGCTPVVNTRGYLPDPIGEASIKVGTDTKTTIQQRLGDPSTQATFNGDSWYYISSVEKQIAFFDPRVETRAVLAVHFDKDGKVIDINHYGLKDGHVVAFETRQTPARGRELTFLQQLFNATPGVPIGTGPEQGQSRRRRSRARRRRISVSRLGARHDDRILVSLRRGET